MAAVNLPVASIRCLLRSLACLALAAGLMGGGPASAGSGNTLADELRVFNDDIARQCLAVKEQLAAVKKSDDPLTAFTLRDAVQSLCVCLPEKTEALKETLSREELAGEITESQFLARFNGPVIHRCAGEQLQAIYGDQCRQRFRRSGLDVRRYCRCMRDVVAGYSDATAGDIAAAAADYLPLAAAAENGGRQIPPRPPVLEAYFQADLACKGQKGQLELRKP